MEQREGPGIGPGSGEALAALAAFGKLLLSLAPVYVAGRLGLSLGFVLLGLALYAGWRAARRAKERSLRAARRLLQDEERHVSAAAAGLCLSARELPAWVSFPDVEKAEWLNKVSAKGGQVSWPRPDGSWLSARERMGVPDLGGSQCTVRGMRRVKQGGCPSCSCLCSYVGDVHIDVEVKKFFCKAGVKGMQLHGVLRVILEPLIGDMPIVGALTMFFIRRPTLDINWTGMTNLLDIPGLSSLSDSMIMDSIAAFLVLPNRLLVPLVPNLHDVAQLRSPLPRGIVRVHLREARDLQSKDKYVKGLIEGKSDPYALVRVGTQVFTSQVIDESLNPAWNETYEFVVHEVPGQELEVETRVGGADPCPVPPQWFPLQDSGRGQLHLRLEWLTLLSDASKLEQVLQRNRGISSKPEAPSAAILVVYLDRAQELPLKKPGKEPNPMVQLSVQDVTRESRVVYNTSSPVWDDAFRFFLQDPANQDIDIQVKDDTRQTSLGSLSVRLSRLLSAEDLTLDQWFQLENSGPGSRIYMKLVMRILFLDAPEVCNTPQPCAPGQLDGETSTFAGSSVDMPPRPSRASPDAQFGTESVIRIHLLEAENLIAKDNFMGGMIRGKSDPYAKVRLGGQSFRSHVVKEELSPRWNEVYEVVVNEIPGQEVEFEIYDKDIDKDDFLGRWVGTRIKLGRGKNQTGWLPLEDVKSGRLHVRLECLAPTPNSAELEQVLMVNSLTQTQRSAELSSALLSVFLDRAADLPVMGGPGLSAFTGSPATPQTATSTSEPIWDEGFSFLVKRPHVESLELQVKDEGGQGLGSLSLPLTQLLAAETLTLDRWFPLSRAGPGSQVLLRVQLGVSHPAGGGGIPVPPHNAAPSLLRSNSELVEGPLGQLQLTVWYHMDERKLVVIVHSCRKLRASSKDIPDPYVSLILLPDKNRVTKRKTTVRKRTLNPEFNERFEWELPPEEATRRRLEACVKNSVSFMSREKEPLGKVHLDLSQMDLAQVKAQWPCQTAPRGGSCSAPGDSG
uniref:Extended synaptotagmin 1 n=1 Tax=Gopherus evgoodei TaxID=1825980 RepID=A0A8C4VVB1_9SAUR